MSNKKTTPTELIRADHTQNCYYGQFYLNEKCSCKIEKKLEPDSKILSDKCNKLGYVVIYKKLN